jgi:hypothetical protein
LFNGGPVVLSSPSARLANKPFEWTGFRHVVSMARGARLPLNGSVRLELRRGGCHISINDIISRPVINVIGGGFLHRAILV